MLEGTFVHYVPAEPDGIGTDPGVDLLALVVSPLSGSLREEPCNLLVFAPDATLAAAWGTLIFIIDQVPYAAEREPGTWHWPKDAETQEGWREKSGAVSRPVTPPEPRGSKPDPLITSAPKGGKRKAGR